MKLILSRLHNSSFEESDLKYEKEARRSKSDVGYLQLRNALSSYTSYTIVELLEDNPNQIIKCITPILNFENWDNVIFNIGDFFIKRFQKTPKIMTVNQKTLNKIDLQINAKLVKEGKESTLHKLSVFDCSHFSLNVCIDESLPDDYISIIFDEQAELVLT